MSTGTGVVVNFNSSTSENNWQYQWTGTGQDAYKPYGDSRLTRPGMTFKKKAFPLYPGQIGFAIWE